MNFGVIESWTFVFLALFCSAAHGGKSENRNTIYIILRTNIYSVKFIFGSLFQLKECHMGILKKTS